MPTVWFILWLKSNNYYYIPAFLIVMILCKGKSMCTKEWGIERFGTYALDDNVARAADNILHVGDLRGRVWRHKILEIHKHHRIQPVRSRIPRLAHTYKCTYTVGLLTQVQ